MRRFRTLVNLVAFFAITAGLVVYGVVDLLGNPLQRPTLVSTTFPDASGVQTNFGVVLNGVVVGSVQQVQLLAHGAKVTIALKPGAVVPDDVVARVGLANDLGEQQVELDPTRKGAAPPLRSGASIPAVPGGVPTEVGKVIGTTTKLLGSIGVSSLNSLLASLAQSLNGRAGDLQSIMQSSQLFSNEFLAYQKQFEALLASSPPILNGVASAGPQLRQDLANTAVLADVLTQHRYDVVHLLADGGNAAAVATQLLDGTRANLGCILHDAADLSANGAQPTNLSNLSVGLATNQWFFGAVEAISPTGPSTSLYAGDPYTANQEWLRTRLLLPPGSPPANEYGSASQLAPSLPGAGCVDEFGRGVGPASQSLPQFPVAGMQTPPPSRQESYVSGGGGRGGRSGRPSNSGTLSAYDTAASPPSGAGAWIAFGLATLVALGLLVPRRRHYAGRDDPRSLRAVLTPVLAARRSPRKEQP